MIYNEEVKDLFTVSDDYYLAHCISADFGMGKGIAVEFNNRFDMKNILKSKYPYYVDKWSAGDCILEGRVFNLVTKRFYYEKPNLTSMQISLEKMKDLALTNNVKKIAMPTIGAGLDRLNWVSVSGEIQTVFSNSGIDILVCKL